MRIKRGTGLVGHKKEEKEEDREKIFRKKMRRHRDREENGEVRDQEER